MTVLATLAAIVAAWPRFSVSVVEGIADTNPLLATFTATYDGYWPLEHVSADCMVERASTSRNVHLFDVRTSRQQVGELSAGNQFTVSCSGRDGVPRVTAEGDYLDAVVSIRITYTARLLATSVAKQYRFATTRASTGSFQWVPLGHADR